MSETLLAVIVGGIIGLVPSIVSAISAENDRKHALQIKRIDLYESERIDALIEFLRCFGAMSCGSVCKDFSVDRYLAASEKASAFVSRSSREIIQLANQYVRKQWILKADPQTVEERNLISAVAESIGKELARSFGDGDRGEN